MILEKIKKNASWLLFAEVINKVVMFVMSILIARSFGNILYGEFNYALSFVPTFSIIADFGLNNLVIREIARNKDKASNIIGNSLILKIFLSLITILLMIITTLILHNNQTGNLLLYIFIPYVIFNGYNNFSKSIYRAFEKMKFETYLKTIEGIGLLLYIIIALLLNKNIFIVTASFAIMAFITATVSLLWIQKFFSKLKFKADKKTLLFLLKESWPFALSGLFVVIYFNIDTIMVNVIRGAEETGYYAASYNFIIASFMIPSILNSALYPMLSQYHNNIQKIEKKIHSYLATLLGISVIGTLLLYFFADQLIYIVYGSEFQNSVKSLHILAFMLPFLFYSSFMGILFSAINKQKASTLILTISVIINIGANYVLITRYGQTGAAAASLIGCIVMCILLYGYYTKTKRKTTYQNTIPTEETISK